MGEKNKNTLHGNEQTRSVTAATTVRASQDLWDLTREATPVVDVDEEEIAYECVCM